MCFRGMCFKTEPFRLKASIKWGKCAIITAEIHGYVSEKINLKANSEHLNVSLIINGEFTVCQKWWNVLPS